MNKNDSYPKLVKAENLAFYIPLLKRKCGSLPVNTWKKPFWPEIFKEHRSCRTVYIFTVFTGSCDLNTLFTAVRRGITLMQTKQRVTVPSADLSPVRWAVNCTDTWSQSKCSPCSIHTVMHYACADRSLWYWALVWIHLAMAAESNQHDKRF